MNKDIFELDNTKKYIEFLENENKELQEKVYYLERIVNDTIICIKEYKGQWKTKDEIFNKLLNILEGSDSNDK